MKRKGHLKRVDWRTFLPEPVVGVDEAGRGCLAGPVVAGAVILNISHSKKRLMFGDSKALSASRREELFIEIQEKHSWSVGFASVEEIETLNILRASLLAMRRAIAGLKVSGGHALVDGKFKIPDLEISFTQTALIKGDARCAPVSAASIVAKVTRDRMMVELAEKFPSYGFEIHKGYATELHRTRIQEFGPCEHHRRTFAGVLEV